MAISPTRTLTFALLLTSATSGPLACSAIAGQNPPTAELPNIAHSLLLNGKSMDTKAYLDQAWEAKGRPGLFYSGGMTWDPQSRQWHVKPNLPEDFTKAVAHYASFTANAASIAVNIAAAYHEVDLADELAKFYSTFLQANFTTLGELRAQTSSRIKQKQLGPELGPDSTRTLAWWQESDGGVILRECYLCNEEYFVPVAGLIEVIAKFKPSERTPAMIQFVAEYLPILVTDHILRLNFAQEMRTQMTPASASLKRRNMSEEEIGVATAAALVLGAHAADPQLVALSIDDRAKLRDLVTVAAQRFQFSRTLTKDSDGRMCASYFNGDYDWQEDYEYVGYKGERAPTPADKATAKGTSWDISHFTIVPMFLRTLYDRQAATAVNYPQKEDLEEIANQYAFHVFEGDYQKPLFRNFFNGTDGWYRVSYLGRSGYGVAPSQYCNMADPTHACLTIAGIYGWGLLAPFNPGVAKIQVALLDLARSTDPQIACFQPQCFRERYYHYADFSFSFFDPQRNLQYPPALLVILAQLTVSYSASIENK